LHRRSRKKKTRGLSHRGRFFAGGNAEGPSIEKKEKLLSAMGKKGSGPAAAVPKQKQTGPTTPGRNMTVPGGKKIYLEIGE